MISITATLVLGLLSLPVLLFLQDLVTWWRLPPGPFPWPFVGNTFDLPSSRPWIKFKEWAERYGPIYTIWIGRRPTLVISDPEVAVDLMEKKSAKFSSRSRMVVMGEIYSNNSSILMQPYGKAWSVRRRLLHQALSPRALQTYVPMQEAEATRLALGLLSNPSGWVKEVERFTASVVFCVACGHRVDSLTAGVVTQRLSFMHYMASLNVPGKYPAEAFPLLAKIPSILALWKREIQAMGQQEAFANLSLFQMVEKEVKASSKTGDDKTPDSLSKLLLRMRSEGQVLLSDLHLSYIPESLFGAGLDTTASSLCFAFLALVTRPHALQRAQAELDETVGPHQSPRYEHMETLPYLQALRSCTGMIPPNTAVGSPAASWKHLVIVPSAQRSRQEH